MMTPRAMSVVLDANTNNGKTMVPGVAIIAARLLFTAIREAENTVEESDLHDAGMYTPLAERRRMEREE